MKKLLATMIFAVAAIACLFGFSACNLGSNESAEPKKLIAPTDIEVSVGSDWVGIERAVYGNGAISRDTEFKLDDGEWLELGNVDYSHNMASLVYQDLEVASTHVIYARCKAYRDYLPSDEFSKQVTLNKGKREDMPEVSVKMDGKTCIIEGFTDEMEVTDYYGRPTDNANGVTQVFDDISSHVLLVRYKETDKYLASTPTELFFYTTAFGSGTGTEDDPYLINNYEQFSAITTGSTQRGASLHFKLTDDITFPDEAVPPIKDSTSYSVHIDGNGKKIKNAKILTDVQDFGWVGIFEELDDVKNLTVENAEVTMTFSTYGGVSSSMVGLIAGDVHNDITDCHVSGTVKLVILDGEDRGEFMSLGNKYVGGLCGYARNISGSTADIKVELPEPPNRGFAYRLVCGGLAGSVASSNGKIEKCSAKLVLDGYAFAASVGGLVGDASTSAGTNRQTIENCFAESIVNLNLSKFLTSTGEQNYGGSREQTYICGLVGTSEDELTFKNCYSHYNFSVNGMNNGFFVTACGLASMWQYYGEHVLTVENCFADGTVNSDSQDNKVNADAVVYINKQYVTANLTDCYYCDLITTTFTEGVTATPVSDLRDVDWQKTHLDWNEEIWEFNDYTADEGYYPTLK